MATGDPLYLGMPNDAGKQRTLLETVAGNLPAFKAVNNSTGSTNYGLYGVTRSRIDGSIGVFGVHNATSGDGIGVKGQSNSRETIGGIGVLGVHNSDEGGGIGVKGITKSTGNYARGVVGVHDAKSGRGIGVRGVTRSNTDEAKGVLGSHNAKSGKGFGLYGRTLSDKGFALGTKGRSQFGGTIFPTKDNTYDCGTSFNRWKTVYSAGGVVTTSLSKFKVNIESPRDIDYLSTVPEPIYFNWKDNDNTTQRLGFMGDNLPDVAKAGDSGIYTNSVIAILCGAIKYMGETIERLEKRMEQLEKGN